ncbi:MAG: NUDIX hydrolase [Proteobacteria bacterium]|nr:NUDIX hydrolase [Burkholderiales bacterium]
MKKVVIERETRLLDDFFKVDAAELSHELFSGGMSSPVRRLNFERGDSVAAVVFNRDTQRVILIEQFRYPAWRKGPGWMTEAVAGIVMPDEAPETALRREVREEIGYDIDALHYVASFYLSPGGSSERIILFCAEVSDAGQVSSGGGVQAEGEDIRVVDYSLDELREEVLFARIEDAKTLVGIMWLLAQGLKGASAAAPRAGGGARG